MGISLPYGYVPGATTVGSPSTQLLSQSGGLAALLSGGASGEGLAIPQEGSGMSAAEVSHHLTPGSSGHSPFDAAKYGGFCRKMRVRVGWGWAGSGILVWDSR